MARFSTALMLMLPFAAALAAPALAQQPLPPPGLYDERLPPIMYDDEDNAPARRAPRGMSQRQDPNRVFPYPDDAPAPPPPVGLFGSTGSRSAGYGHQLDAQQPSQPLAAQAPAAANSSEPGALRPPAAVGAPAAASQPAQTANSVMTLPPEDQPETGQPKELPPNLKRQLVDFTTKEPAGTIIIDTPNTYLYLVLGSGKALRYGIGVGREGFTWSGTERISRMKEWPDWFPPAEMIERQPYLPRMMAGGPGNPLGARALYLGHTLYRIHGTNQPSTIGSFVSSGCIRLLNEDIEDLYSRVQVGTRVVVLPGGKAPEHVANTGAPANVVPPGGTANSSAAISSSPLPPVR
ncbi:MAG TPA: L,D-transpeptidase family protein [Pseudolabrys sp.]|nr:L,D-transpeptidase family protein [Pseudolabrys sp.]